MKFLSLLTLMSAFSICTLITLPGTVNASQRANYTDQNRTTTYSQKVLRGNYSTHIFHYSHCRYYNCKKCTVIFKSYEEAHTKGYRACKKCGG